MKKFLMLAAAAAIATPALISAASAESVTVRVGSPGYHARAQERVVVRHAPACRMVTTRVHRGNRTVVTKTRRCY
jgi:hypothetical protein